jgi:hypothetical protein
VLVPSADLFQRALRTLECLEQCSSTLAVEDFASSEEISTGTATAVESSAQKQQRVPYETVVSLLDSLKEAVEYYSSSSSSDSSSSDSSMPPLVSAIKERAQRACNELEVLLAEVETKTQAAKQAIESGLVFTQTAISFYAFSSLHIILFVYIFTNL